jgi:hypothetical protein
MSTYRWDSPSSWLRQKLTEGTAQTLQARALRLAAALDDDTIQDLFQDEMDEDGYFNEVKP